MAQSGLRSFYPVRRRREEDTQAATKRRKLTASSHLEVRANDEQLDTSDLSYGEASATAKKPTTRSRKAGGRATTKKSQSVRGKRCKKGDTTDVPNIKTLLEIINQTTNGDEVSPTTNRASDNKRSEECPLPQTGCSASKSSSVALRFGQRSSQQTSTSYPSPFKVPATLPEDSRSRTSTPKSSPVKIAAALSPASSRSVTHTTTTSSPGPESRGARLIRLAKEKMAVKSPVSKVASPAASNDPSSSIMTERSTRMAARRKLLTNPDPPSATSGSSKSVAAKFFPSKEQDRQDMVGELYKLSKKELAQPMRYENAKVKRRERACNSDGEKKKESGPKLREFGAFEFVSPTKNEAAKTRYVVMLLTECIVCFVYNLPSLSLSHSQHTYTRLPAYQKFHALAQPVAPSVTTPTPETPLPSAAPPVELPLPYSYQLLEEKFRCTDTVVSMLQKRKEICTFEKLKTAVQEMSRRWALFRVHYLYLDMP